MKSEVYKNTYCSIELFVGPATGILFINTQLYCTAIVMLTLILLLQH